MIRFLREKFHGKRMLRSIGLLLFAVILTYGAVAGQQQIKADLTNSGANGATANANVKNFASDVDSDDQGSYFYILPVTDYTKIGKSYAGTLYSTHTTDDNGNEITFRDLFLSNEDISDYMNWSAQYRYYRKIAISSVPPQTTKALLFVPYATYNSTSLKSGWKANISSICYYDATASSVSSRYKISTDASYVNYSDL